MLENKRTADTAPAAARLAIFALFFCIISSNRFILRFPFYVIIITKLLNLLTNITLNFIPVNHIHDLPDGLRSNSAFLRRLGYGTASLIAAMTAFGI